MADFSNKERKDVPGARSPSDSLADVDEKLADLTGLPAGLSGEPRRQAVPSIQGTVYQAWWSIDAWLQLSGANEVIYLEGAEDFDFVRTDLAVTVQVKRNAGTISLGTKKALEALENFWTLSLREAHRRIDFHYLTTSSVAMEQNADFDGQNGIELWRAAQTNPDSATTIRDYLVSKLGATSPLRAFLASATPELVQDRLIRRFHWLTEQPDLDAVKQSVDERIVVLLRDQRLPPKHSSMVRKYLESRFWEIITKSSPAQRRLTLAELLSQIEAATTVTFTVRVDKLPDLIAITRPGVPLLNLLLEKVPMPPEPLLRRPELTKHLEKLVRRRNVVLITGTVHKGKTTLAQLVSWTLCPEASWVNLTGLRPNEVDMVLHALANRIESGNSPSLVIIDDLDIGPTAYRVYRDSLRLVTHRASNVGSSLMLTAQGGLDDSALVRDSNIIVAFEVPEIDPEEIKVLCIEHGCPHEIAKSWGSLIFVWTGGHPKLVQVRLAELAARGWPIPTASDLTSPSPAEVSVRQLARRLMSESVPEPIAEFVYLVSESSTLLDRSVAIRLAESIGLRNGGDVLDSLIGKWFELIEGQWFRATGLLKGVAKEVWTSEKSKEAHVRLHDAIIAKHTLSPHEAAAIIFHAYMGGDPFRLAMTASRLQIVENEEARRETERCLLWLPYVALEPGQRITEDARAGAILRGVQFRVASTLGSEVLAKICARWEDEVERISHPEFKAVNQTMMWLSLGFSEDLNVPLRFRLEAIRGIPTLPAELLESYTDLGMKFFGTANEMNYLPEGGTVDQIIFLNASRRVRGLDDLNELLLWLDNVATEEIRQQFDQMLKWPLTQQLGAFVQGAWAAVHEITKDWEPWLSLLGRVEEYAKRRSSPRFGIEAAKAKSIILAEYLRRVEDAFAVLDQAEVAFGQSVVLMEQRANVLFQAHNDESVLAIWNALTLDPGKITSLNPFAYRMAGMSAGRLGLWAEAGQIFCEGADSIKPGSFDLTKFGLRVDAALALLLGGDQVDAANILKEAVLSLPVEAGEDGDAQWEAVQRAAAEVCRAIENGVWKPAVFNQPFELGYASSPALKVTKVEPGQAFRSETTCVEILRLFSTLGSNPIELTKRLDDLAESRHFFVRWRAIEARLALAYSSGAGGGFIQALVAFDGIVSEFSAIMQQGVSPATLLNPDDGPTADFPIAPERWFGLLCAGAVCAGPALLERLATWLQASVEVLSKEAALTSVIRILLEGASLPAGSLEPAIINTDLPSFMRCGAAAQLLQEPLTAKRTIETQAFLASGFVADDSYNFQELFNHHVALCFANIWRRMAENRFYFYSPDDSVPALVETLDRIERGSGTLKSVLVSAARALMHPLGEFMKRVI